MFSFANALRVPTILSLACLVAVSGCVGVFYPHEVSDEVIASCVRSSGLPEGTQYTVEEVFRTDGMDRRVVRGPQISQDQAFRINKCIEGRVIGTAGLPSVAGVPQSMSSVPTATGRTDTFVYGTPPAGSMSASPGASIGSTCARRGNVMQGGTGYCGGS